MGNRNSYSDIFGFWIRFAGCFGPKIQKLELFLANERAAFATAFLD
jgi:hypothetical protein